MAAIGQVYGLSHTGQAPGRRIRPRIIVSLNVPDTLPQTPAAPPSIAEPALPSLLPAIPEAGRKTAAGPYAGSSDALALAQLARACAGTKHIVAVVTGDPLSAQRLTEEIPWFAPGLRVALFPDWETLPYDHFSPHQDLVSERLATLYRISRGECDVAVVAATTALYRLAPPTYLAAFTFSCNRASGSTSSGCARNWHSQAMRTSRRWSRRASSACAAA